MWPFGTKAKKPARVAPMLPFVDGTTWALGATANYISPEAAQSISAALACVNLISETIGALPAVVTLADDSRKEQPDHPLSTIIVAGCNDNENWSDLLGAFVASALLHGNGAIEQTTDDRGRLTALQSIAWPSVTPWAAPDGSLCLDVRSTLPPDAGTRRTLLRSDFALLKDRGDNSVLGVSRLSRAANALQLALLTQTSTVQFTANSVRPSGTLNSPGRLSKETADRLATDWGSNYSKEGRGRVAVLPEGLVFKPLSEFSAEDQQVVERLRYTVEDVARLFGVPVYFLDPSKTTYASATAATVAFQRGLLPWIAKIERSFAQTILNRKYRLLIDVSALIRADPEAMANALAKYRAAGILSPNDCRAELDYPAVANGNSIEPPVSGGKPAGSEGDNTGKGAVIGFRDAAD